MDRMMLAYLRDAYATLRDAANTAADRDRFDRAFHSLPERAA